VSELVEMIVTVFEPVQCVPKKMVVELVEMTVSVSEAV
jgi:hypothetical protein